MPKGTFGGGDCNCCGGNCESVCYYNAVVNHVADPSDPVGLAQILDMVDVPFKLYPSAASPSPYRCLFTSPFEHHLTIWSVTLDLTGIYYPGQASVSIFTPVASGWTQSSEVQLPVSSGNYNFVLPPPVVVASPYANPFYINLTPGPTTGCPTSCCSTCCILDVVISNYKFYSGKPNLWDWTGETLTYTAAGTGTGTLNQDIGSDPLQWSGATGAIDANPNFALDDFRLICHPFFGWYIAGGLGGTSSVNSNYTGHGDLSAVNCSGSFTISFTGVIAEFFAGGYARFDVSITCNTPC